jgi:hypothetical protein
MLKGFLDHNKKKSTKSCFVGVAIEDIEYLVEFTARNKSVKVKLKP